MTPVRNTQQDLGPEFFQAGKARFTVETPEKHFTYECDKKTYPKGNTHYHLRLLKGPDNRGDYVYLGCIEPLTGHLRMTRKSQHKEDSATVLAINTTLPLLWRGTKLPPGYDVMHSGKCGRCQRPLTVPESVRRGLGPICAVVLGTGNHGEAA